MPPDDAAILRRNERRLRPVIGLVLAVMAGLLFLGGVPLVWVLLSYAAAFALTLVAIHQLVGRVILMQDDE